MSYLNIESAGRSPSGKTERWLVKASDNSSILGKISWFCTWRRYVFSPSFDIVLDPTCLREIADFMETKTKEHKNATTKENNTGSAP